MRRPLIIAPSLLAADFARFGEETKDIMDAGADWLHLDVMDGHFVPNISFGPQVIQSIRKFTKKPFDVHLMISPVDSYLEAFANAGADVISVHAEAGPHLHRSLQQVRALGKKAGVVINPGSPASLIEPVLDLVDLVLVMSVNPGFGGQSFIRGIVPTLEKVSTLIGNRPIDFQIDGGITPETAPLAVKAGVNVLVAGSAAFRGGKPFYTQNIKAIRDSVAGL